MPPCYCNPGAIGVVLAWTDLTHNHCVTNIAAPVRGNVCKANEAEGVRAFYTLELGTFDAPTNALAEPPKLIGVGRVPYGAVVGVVSELSMSQHLASRNI